MRDDYDEDTSKLPEPTKRDYITVTLWVVIPTILLGYVALWRVGVI